jgi:putative ABC transport system permease protein
MNIHLIILRQALNALWAYKGRTFLTMLGIIIGIGTIILMVSMGKGVQTQITDQINKMGTHLLFVTSGSAQSGGAQEGAGTLATLRVKDAEAIASQCPSIEHVAYTVISRGQIVYGNKNWATAIQGTTEKSAIIGNWQIVQGEYIGPHHEKSASSVAVLGKVVADRLFGPDESGIGKTIRIRNFPFTVIGVLAPKGRTPDGRDADDIVIVPYAAAEAKFIRTKIPGIVHVITASANSDAQVPGGKWEIENTLRITHQLPEGEEDDFTVRTLNEYVEALEKATDTMTYLLVAVASISLAVGGIGIMNIMLVTVTERTREIGVRMAIGARQQDILTQFLIESASISLLGGIIGILLGFTISNIVAGFAGWQMFFSWPSIALATVFSCMVGIFFGFYPALKASRLNPVEALHYE